MRWKAVYFSKFIWMNSCCASQWIWFSVPVAREAAKSCEKYEVELMGMVSRVRECRLDKKAVGGHFIRYGEIQYIQNSGGHVG